MTSGLVEESFGNEFDDQVRLLIRQLLDDSQPGELTLHIFDVRFDPHRSTVTLIDDLDPSRAVELDARHFARLVDDA